MDDTYSDQYSDTYGSSDFQEATPRQATHYIPPSGIYVPFNTIDRFLDTDIENNFDQVVPRGEGGNSRTHHSKEADKLILLSSFLQQLSRNENLVNQLKIEAKLGNVNPVENTHGEKVHRKSPASPYLIDKIALWSTQVRMISGGPGANIIRKGQSSKKDRIPKSITFPSNNAGPYFSSTYLPVVTASIMYWDIAKPAIVLSNIKTTGFSFDVIELDGNIEIPAGKNFHVFFLAIGVKGKYWHKVNTAKPHKKRGNPPRFDLYPDSYFN